MPADVVFRVGRAYGMTADRGVYQVGEWIISSRCWHETHLQEGRLPTDGPVDDLPSREPALTVVGGRPVHDPDGLFGLSGAA